MTLTREQRHEVYKQALSYLRNRTGFYLCEALRESLPKEFLSGRILFYSEVLQMFPEVLSKKPEVTWAGCVWFPLASTKRIEILEQAIKETQS